MMFGRNDVSGNVILGLFVLLTVNANPLPSPIDFESVEIDGVTVDYAVVVPQGFEPGGTYPVLLALPPGGQDRGMVAWGVDRYWHLASERGWVVVSPAAPGGRLFYQGSESKIPGLLDHLAKRVTFEGGKVHVAGVSNGGLSAFRIVLEHPERYASLVALPGSPPGQGDMDRLGRLAGIPVAMFVGGDDKGWRERMESTRDRLEKLGVPVSLEVYPGEGHVIRSLGAEQVFDLFEGFRSGGKAGGR